MTASRVLSILLAALAACFAWAAEPVASISIPGRAVSGTRELPAEIRGTCVEKGSIEVLLALTFKTIAEADAFFPLSTYEGPDGKSASLQIAPTRSAKPTSLYYNSASGWFGVHNDFLLALRPADAWDFF